MRFVYGVSQFVKYEVLHSIESERDIELFGDTGWQHIFPDYYKGYLDRERINDLFSRNEHLYLLMNWQTTWFETSGAITEAIAYQVPFINHPSFEITSGLRGLKNIEYRNSKELNDRINNIHRFINDDVTDSIRYLNGVANECMTSLADNLVDNLEYVETRLDEQMARHDLLIKAKVEAYIDQNEDFLRYTFNSLFITPIQYDIRQSKYFTRPYVQRLLEYRAQINTTR